MLVIRCYNRDGGILFQVSDERYIPLRYNHILLCVARKNSPGNADLRAYTGPNLT
jgi:hypothetical protein